MKTYPSHLNIDTVRTMSAESSSASTGKTNVPKTKPQLTMDEVAAATTQTLKTRAEFLDTQLLQLKNTTNKSDLNVLVGQEDFFTSSSLASNAYMDPSRTYEFIAGDLVGLSKKYPNVIIAPGAIYISSSIPEFHNGYRFVLTH